MGKQGRKRISAVFSAETMAGSIDRVYQELLRKRGIISDA
jgi:hypothetical protein